MNDISKHLKRVPFIWKVLSNLQTSLSFREKKYSVVLLVSNKVCIVFWLVEEQCSVKEKLWLYSLTVLRLMHLVEGGIC